MEVLGVMEHIRVGAGDWGVKANIYYHQSDTESRKA